MKKFTAVALSLAALLAMTGCSISDDDSGSGTDTGGDTSQKTKYEGTWKDSHGFTLVINGTTVQISANNAGEGISLSLEGAGNFAIQGTKTIQPNNKTVDKITHTIVTCNAEMTATTADAVTGMNANNICGGGWKINTAKDVSACQMPGDSKTICGDIQEGEKDIFYLEKANKLYSGDSDQGLDANGYPEALETDFMTKQ